MGGTGSGGARARSGPPPNPHALRRDRSDDAEWLTLPAEGRKGETPPWPLTPESQREADLWHTFWLKPQATIWEERGLEFEVALFVRRFAEAEQRDASATLSTLVRQMMDSLGLSTQGLLRNRWRIGDSEAPAAPAKGGRKPRGSSARGRLKVVPPPDEG